ncbi:MAG: apolipoprotein N-acyltransferase [Candidatus Omnitrophica bacterium]|nr:apolipoprotein N-acyltransferase [Candidatus Omnitrophota bacterium]
MLRKKLKAKDYLLSILSAFLLILSFPDLNLWFCAWFAFVPVFFALNNKTAKEAFLLFFITGSVFWAGTIYWLVHVTFAGTLALIFYLSLYFAFFGALIRPVTRRSNLQSLIFIPCLWVLLEYIRGFFLTGFPWALLGYSQYQNLPVIQVADICGAWGVSFLIVFVNAAIVEMVWAAKNGFWPRLKTTAVLLSTVLVLVLGYGYYKLYHRPCLSLPVRQAGGRQASTIDHRPFKISVIQGNIPQEIKWHADSQEMIIDKYFLLTKEASGQDPDLIVWPEAALPSVLEEEPVFYEKALALAEQIRIPLLLGSATLRGSVYYNSALLVSKEGRAQGRYDKLHLVPFGEYIPLRGSLPFLETVVPIGDFAAGSEYTVFPITATRYPLSAKFSVLICFEDLFPQLSRRFRMRGADFLINITNDAWFKKTSSPNQHLSASVFRAVENRVNLVRSANTGVSAFIDPKGRIASLLRNDKGETIFVDGFLTQDIYVSGAPLSLYTRYGDFFVLFCLIFLIIYFILKKRR